MYSKTAKRDKKGKVIHEVRSGADLGLRRPIR